METPEWQPMEEIDLPNAYGCFLITNGHWVYLASHDTKLHAITRENPYLEIREETTGLPTHFMTIPKPPPHPPRGCICETYKPRKDQ